MIFNPSKHLRVDTYPDVDIASLYIYEDISELTCTQSHNSILINFQISLCTS